MATIASSFFSLPSLRTTNNPHTTTIKTSTLLSFPNFVQPTRLSISYSKRKGLLKHVFPLVISCLVEDNFNTEQSSSASLESNPGATIDLKLPRRSLLVQFTCNACGVRSQKLINRLAYEKGMVFVQCTGCSQYHKLVDNLNLVVEYDFREENNASPDADQV